MGGLFGGGSSSTTVVNQTPAPSEEEKALIGLNADIARRQLAALDQIQPFQKELLDLSLADLRRQSRDATAVDAVITPEQQAQFVKQDFERAQRLGPVQDELLQLQLEGLRRGGAATPEQEARIGEATQAGIAAGSADIDASTSRGLGLISDELANSRGLRLTDSPIRSEAALLAREGEIQKGLLTRNLRSAEATAKLNFPLAAQQMTSGIATSQQQLAESARQFQAELRQRAFQNRLALTGQGQAGGLGLASITDGGRALGALAANRMGNTTSTQTTSGGGGLGFMQALGGVGTFASGAAAIAPFLGFSDPELKVDYGVVAKTEEGIPLHLFKYKGEAEETPLRLGVMADEVERVKPEAVYRHSSGYKVVDYARIGDVRGLGLADE